MVDHDIMVALEEAFQFGFPLDAEAILIIEVDGIEAGLNAQRDQIIEICQKTGAGGPAGRKRKNIDSSCGKLVSKPLVLLVAWRPV